MSDTTPTFTATSSVAAPESSQAEQGGGGKGNSNLYLVTFLATLFLLLFVSCGIVLRSYVLRRQYQRQMNFALANGVLMTPRAQGSKRRRLGLRPRLYENWITPLFVGGYKTATTRDYDGVDDEISEKPVETNEKQAGFSSGWAQGRWCDMLPVTVQTVIVKRRSKETGGTPPLSALSPSYSTMTQLTASPPSAFPSPVTGSRPFLSHITPPSSFLSRNQMGDAQALNAEQRRSSRALSIRFADQMRLALLSFPHPHMGASPENQGRRPSQARRTNTLPPLSTIQNDPLRSRRNSSNNSAAPTRERRDSATWMTIISPNPALPIPIPPIPSSRNGGSEWSNQDNGHNWGLRLTLGRLLPFSRQLNDGPENDNHEMEPAGMSTTVEGGPSRATLSKYRIRTEMLQISVLVAMPSLKTSRLYGDANVVKNSYGSYHGRFQSAGDDDDSIKKHRGSNRRRKRRSSGGRGKVLSDESGDVDEVVEIPGEEVSDESESESEEGGGKFGEDDDPPPLPELVLGVTRLNYRPPNQPVVEPVEEEEEQVDNAITPLPQTIPDSMSRPLVIPPI